jgi:hypothetical protein
MPQSLTEQLSRAQQIEALEKDWATNPRWKGIERGYSAADVVRLRGSFPDRAHAGPPRRREVVGPAAHRALRELPRRADRWSGDAAGQGRHQGHLPVGLAGGCRQQLLRVDVPRPVAVPGGLGANRRRAHQQHLPPRRRNPAQQGHRRRRQGLHRQLRAHRGRRRSRFRWRAQRLRTDEGHDQGRCGGVHWEDQLASVKKCGHMGGKVLVPTAEANQKLIAARMAADVCGVPSLVIARTDAEAADLLTSDYDENDKPFITGERTPKASTRPARASTRRSRARLPMRVMPIWCGARPARRTWTSPRSLPTPCTRCTPARCWPTTARRRSTGRRTWTTRPSPSSSANSVPWATSTSSSRWPASTPCGTTCSTGAGLRQARHVGLCREGAGARVCST